MKSAAQKPVWLDEPLIQRLLHSLLDKLERGVKPSLKVSAKTAAELFDFNEDTNFLWALVESLDKDCQLLTIKKAKVEPFQEAYEGAQLWLVPDCEERLRQWLNRPALDPYALVWHKELERLADGALKNHLTDHLIRIPELGAEQTLRGLLAIGRELCAPMTLRQLSARCFRGNSKVLDRHGAWVEQLYPELAHWVLPRPLLVSAHLPERFAQVLFIENQDTFLSLAGQPQTRYALVYSSGFALSAERIRTQGQAVFAYTQASEASRVLFETFWFSQNTQYPVHFWGDLDFAGMGILRALRTSFNDVQAWPPGYQPMLARLQQGEGHSAAMAAKAAQLDPGTTGCAYADDELLVAIRRQQGFVDQEAVQVNLAKGER
ncbi:DUF2220 domain-containing protein [Gilvimarinus agarilyticus]|uniref:Wadjet anti-phage system protein JetD domain-containing protein n=1 Tax=Gilvimarinus sp. 2_MG-2023 TaxID=3062666 RepID=UPI001C089DC8|nr:Wadjet anti-phage system protein JetD domain-containing protein [Gilvimarinus sp. 2_MG-2023]MBU2884983.1 DUF2220 domain-containing protein [Gilvimarinus agarilyticus]MDO6569880.1 DUF2220 family protein [Gilvimarinus sp. 2_MG-2023]